MKIQEYLYKATKGQSRSNNIFFFEGGVGSGIVGHTTNNSDEASSSKIDMGEITKANIKEFLNETIKRQIKKVKDNPEYSIENSSNIHKPLPDNYETMKQSDKLMKPKGEKHRCYQNSMNIAKKNPNMKLAVGILIANINEVKTHSDFVLSDEDSDKFPVKGFMPQILAHAWNVDKDGIIYDDTLGNYPGENDAYIGEIVDVNDFKDDAALEDYVWKQLYNHESPNNVSNTSKEGGSGSGIKGHYTSYADDPEINQLLNDFENNPKNAKGNGLCQLAVQQIAKLLLSKGYNKNDMKVQKIVTLDKNGSNSFHVILKLGDIYIDPTGTQYEHPNHQTITKELPDYYKPDGEAPLDFYIN